MNQDQIAEIRLSFFKLIPQAEELSISFYERMFRDHPEVRSRFKPDMQSQQDKLMDTIAALLDMIENPEAVSATLTDLGKRHSSYGATKEMYDWITATLPDMIAERLGAQCDESTVQLWRGLLETAGKVMMAGAT